MEFASWTLWNMDSSTARNWIDSVAHPCLRTLSSMSPNRGWSLSTIVRWLLEVQHTMSYSVTTTNHEEANGWRWVRKRPKSTIMTWTLARYSPRHAWQLGWQRLLRRYRWIQVQRRQPCNLPILGHPLEIKCQIDWVVLLNIFKPITICIFNLVT